MQKLLAVLSTVAVACGDDTTPMTTPHPDAPAPSVDAPEPDIDAPPTPACTPKTLRTDLTWYGTNRSDLAGWIDEAGCTSAGYDAAHKPVATFDWDNTISKNDFGDAITFYLVKNDKVRQPPNQDWKQTSGYMTDAAAAALTAACGITVPAGSPLPTSTNTACADEILSLYIDGVTTTGAAGFTGHNYRMMEPTYAWTAQLMAGYTHAEVSAMATAAITPQLSAAEGAVQTVGSRTNLNGWLRIYEQSKDLIEVMQSAGYDVWIITASPQDVIAAFAPMVGIAADHVIGIHSKTDGAGKLTYKFEGCGNVADDNQSMITYIAGKRCWINKVIYGDTSPNAILVRPDGERQYFAAGDSDTDTEFLRDATYRLVINRNKNEVMCHAYYNANDTWRVNPMFILPKGMKTSKYPCSTTACKNEAGVGMPCRDDGGNIIPDQTDIAFGP